MTKRSSPFQMDMISTTLRVIVCFMLLRSCLTRNYFVDLDLSTQTLNPTVTGFMITGEATGDIFGASVSATGDIDNDGYDDIVVGAPAKNGNKGEVYVIYGGEESSFVNRDLSTTPLNPLTTGFMITGSANNDNFAYPVSIADINNDGYADIIAAAQKKNGNPGAVYVIYGGPKSTMSNIALSSASLDPLTSGFMITGEAANSDNFGVWASTAGDVNNDGYADIIVGANQRMSFQGAAYVIYGGPKSTMSNIALSSTPLIPLSTGFMITGTAAGENFGYPVSTAGDIDNDGYDDIIVGAYFKDSSRGAAYVIYGGPKSTMSNIVLTSPSTLDPLTTGFLITGHAAGDIFGASVSTAGDVNNDGYADIIVGAQNQDGNQGAVYVIYGGPKSTVSNIALSSISLDPFTSGFMITGNAVGDKFGNIASTAGDVNNDAYADIIVGAQNKNGDQGAVYVIYGGPKSTMSNIALNSTSLNPLTTGFMITGNAAGDAFGSSVSAAGDVNNDGYDDIIAGTGGKNTAYVIFASCSKNCKQCSSESVCTECKSSYLMYQSECFASCPNTTLATSTTTCEDCPAYCNHCNSTSLCTECISSFVLDESQCFASCPKAMFNSNNVCKDCPPFCSSCTSQDSCQACYQGYTLSNSLCILSGAQEQAIRTVSSVTRGIGSVVCVGSAIFPLSALVSKIVQNTRYLNLSVTSDLAEVYQTWQTDIISWDVPNVMSDLDHFRTAPPLFAQFDVSSPFLVNFWPNLLNLGFGFGTFIACVILQKLFEHTKYEGWAYSFVRKLVAGSFNFALVQAYACMDEILFDLVIDAKTNPFNSLFSWTSMICAVIFLGFGCLLVFFNFWTVTKYQRIKQQGAKALEDFNEKNKYWELFYSDFKDDDLWSQSFFAILIIRSVLSSCIITVLYDYPLMQTAYLVTMDGTIILFLYFKTPFNTLRGTLAQYYYEIITLLVHLCAFILSLQDTFKNPSHNIKIIMSTGILYLNTAIMSGALGFMFIEIYETIRLKHKTLKRRQHQSVSEDNQETQSLTRAPIQLQLSQIDAPKRQAWTAHNSTLSTEKPTSLTEGKPKRSLNNSDVINLESSHALESNFDTDHSRELDVYPSNRINQERNQLTRQIAIRHRPKAQAPNQRQQGNNFIFPSSTKNHRLFSNN